MADRTWIWLLGGAGAAAILLSSNRAQRSGPIETANSRDLDALADMLITETSFNRAPAEMAQIVWVAVNRATKHGNTIPQVVFPPGRPTWNTGALYKKRYLNARNSQSWRAARAFAAEVLQGRHGANRGFTKFVHPRGMPTPPCASNRVAMSTTSGTRCMPTWMARGKNVSGAMFD